MLTQEQFERCFSQLIGNEGGYSNNPQDPGGETMWGVTKRVAEAYGYTGQMKRLPLVEAQRIAKAEYWDRFRCGEFPMPIAYQILDTAYNGGRPIVWLQQLFGLPETGEASNGLLARAGAANPWEVVAKFNSSRLRYLAALRQPAFADGRMNRIATNLMLGGME